MTNFWVFRSVNGHLWLNKYLISPTVSILIPLSVQLSRVRPQQPLRLRAAQQVRVRRRPRGQPLLRLPPLRKHRIADPLLRRLPVRRQRQVGLNTRVVLEFQVINQFPNNFLNFDTPLCLKISIQYLAVNPRLRELAPLTQREPGHGITQTNLHL